MKVEETLSKSCELRQNKHLNKIVEQDHRLLKQLVNSSIEFGSFNTANLKGYEVMNTSGKGQIQGVESGILSQVELGFQIFAVAA